VKGDLKTRMPWPADYFTDPPRAGSSLSAFDDILRAPRSSKPVKPASPETAAEVLRRLAAERAEARKVSPVVRPSLLQGKIYAPNARSRSSRNHWG
jgi:hypothetical protein